MNEFLLHNAPHILGGGQLGENAGDGTENGAGGHSESTGDATTPPSEQPRGGFGDWWMILMWIGVLVGVFMLMNRSQRKRERQLKEVQANLAAGDNIVTSGGLYGRVTEVNEDNVVVEFGIGGRGTRIPVARGDIMGKATPSLSAASTKESPKELPAKETKE